MKKLLLPLALTSLMLPCFNASASSEIKVIVNGEQLEFAQPPVIRNNRTLVPMRAIFEALGAYVEWDGENREVYGYKTGVGMYIPIDKNEIRCNSITIPIDSPAKIVNNTTMIPLRVVSECLGMDVKWDGVTHTATITDTGKLQYMDWNDNYYYNGMVENGVATGYGELYDIKTSQLFCSGKFENDIFLKGLMTSDDGDYYMGEFNEFSPNGYGTYYWPSGDYYEGDFKNGNRHGYGTMYFADGDRYEGMYENDKRNGQGVMYYTDGDCYAGNFIDGAENGYGIYSWANGDRYEGDFKNGNRHGQGTYYLSDGTHISGIWENGTLSQENSNSQQKNDVFISESQIVPSLTQTQNETVSLIENLEYFALPFHIYSNDGKTYLGKAIADKYDQDSLTNDYGKYGSTYRTTSIWNTYGTYGSQYSNESAFNDKATKPPIVVDSYGNFVGYLTTNTSLFPVIDIVEVQVIMSIYSQDNNAYQNAFCAFPDCERAPQRDSFYCSYHECISPNCHNRKPDSYSSYCIIHE